MLDRVSVTGRGPSPRDQGAAVIEYLIHASWQCVAGLLLPLPLR